MPTQHGSPVARRVERRHSVVEIAATGRHRSADEAMRAGSRSCAFCGRAVGDRHHRGASGFEKAGQEQRHRRLVSGKERDHGLRVFADTSADIFLPARAVVAPHTIFARGFHTPKLSKRGPVRWGSVAAANGDEDAPEPSGPFPRAPSGNPPAGPASAGVALGRPEGNGLAC